LITDYGALLGEGADQDCWQAWATSGDRRCSNHHFSCSLIGKLWRIRKRTSSTMYSLAERGDLEPVRQSLRYITLPAINGPATFIAPVLPMTNANPHRTTKMTIADTRSFLEDFRNELGTDVSVILRSVRMTRGNPNVGGLDWRTTRFGFARRLLDQGL
jgi:hypothetical protein